MHKETPSSISSLICLYGMLLLAASYANCKETGKGSDSESTSSRRALDSHLAEDAAGEPRQYFKIHMGPNQARKRAFRAALAVRRNGGEQNSQSTKQQRDQVTTSGGSQKQKISNATLKKLLNQSLSMAANGTNYYKNDKGSNFKFVFIQRATAAPKSHSKTDNEHSSIKSGSSNSTAQQPSLAASVSKQLAKSLLSSATNLMANLSSVPSLSSLATQMVNQKVDLTELNSISSISRRKQQSTSNVNHSASKTPISPASKTRQPSKIYNLPVKFVANGQPNHVVFSTIKKHFATIKKLQDERQKSYGSLGQTSEQVEKMRRKHKLKGNSRLIYLPIKYLSNAKPNRILATHATKTHKSSS